MKNRTSFSPILSAVVLGLVTWPSLPSKAETGGSNSSVAAAAQTEPATGGPSAAKAAKQPIFYTVVKGDSWTSIAQKFRTTRKKLKALNNLTASTVKPGQILLVPSGKNTKPGKVTLNGKVTARHTYPAAQLVQDFDIPASTFGSCPDPALNQESEASSPEEPSAPIAKLVSPAEMAAESEPQNIAPATSVSRVARPETRTMPEFSAPGYSRKISPTSGMAASNRLFPPTSRPTAAPLLPRSFSQDTSPSVQPNFMDSWASRFVQEARTLGDEGIAYDEDWRPPGESHSWTMDCSNTSRYLYKITAGIQLPRTASDQYYYLHLQGKAWDVPQAADGWADTAFLRRNLKPGDLLFWENTYRPERQPPITHVMVFLGTNERGQWIMAGSQTSRGGEHNRRNGGPDIYVFRPSQACGGYTTWMGLVHHQGRFCAFGRPLEADPAKLAVAEND